MPVVKHDGADLVPVENSRRMAAVLPDARCRVLA